ncbi:MAG TPA: right-handed parallel beta-helix repeat-containing protein [Ktedonosporobacter sp.]|jgi:plastocyanin|nr:right-handed parallel beta-helix repeat-containing protein [Ktedonosporobacter sp.]
MLLSWQHFHFPPKRSKTPALFAWSGFALLTILLLAMLAACGGAGGSAPSGPRVTMLDNEFSPKQIHINAGDTITWMNNGQVAHTVTADDHKFDSGNIDAGKTYSHTFTEPGTYAYYCALHGAAGGVGMAGVIIVDPPANSSRYDYQHANSLQRTARKFSGATLRVPEDFPTINDALTAAKSGDMISIAPGTYHEALIVKTPDITIRGRDRNGVIMEGDFKLSNAFEVVANNVVIENMTARHYVSNGFYWTGVTGFRGSYLTAYTNGDYGVYAYNSNTGQFDHSLAAGQPDSGFYIGDCHPCHAVITNVISEDNALGYSGTNAGGDLTLRDSIWRDNISGIVPNTLDSEPNPPQDGAAIINNLIENNNNENVPTKGQEYPSIGNGIVLAGGNNNLVANNRINGHRYYGILIVPNIDKSFWVPSGNTVKGNYVTNSGVADLALAALSGGNNCFSDNKVARTSPPLLQFTHACGSLMAHAGAGDPGAVASTFVHFMQVAQNRYVSPDWKTRPVPADINQPGMPDPNSTPQGIFTSIEGTSLNMTPAAAAYAPTMTLAGIGLANPFFEVLTAFYAYYLPLALYAAWVSIAMWDIVRRAQLKDGTRLGWMAVVLLIPILGPIAYFLFGRSEISRSTRWALVVGAPVLYVVVSLALLFFIS